MFSYVVFVFFAGAASLRDASGSLQDLANGTLSLCTPDCQYGTFNNYQVKTVNHSTKNKLFAEVFIASNNIIRGLLKRTFMIYLSVFSTAIEVNAHIQSFSKDEASIY